MKTTALYSFCGSHKEDEMSVYEVRLNPDHDIFKGHFPGMPVMPGVCMLQLLKDCITETTGKHYRFDYIKNCKFVSVVNPKENPLLTVTFVRMETDLQATIFAGETPVLKLRTTLAEK